MNEETVFSKEDYLQTLELCYEVAESINGKLSQDGRMPDCQYLALKLYAHAASAYWLSMGTRAPVPRSTNGSSFIDFASIAVIARVALETYLTLFEVFMMAQSDDEFEFDYCLWHLSGRVIHENITPTDPTLFDEYKSALVDIADLRSRIQQTAKFSTLTIKQKAVVLKGVRKRTWKDVAEKAGFGVDFIRKIYSFNSSYVHADGLSASQLMSAQSKVDQEFHTQIHLLTILIVMSKMILNYAEKFSEAASVCKQFPLVYERTKRWSEAVARIP
ncbi:MAG: hypothetical protein HY863_18055 [Chloroflexi bacterium]|nr:hypothetical protein [Chloroflexota bacterium]